MSDPMLFGRHIVELNATNNTLVRSYVWGLDMSGSLSGVGGVGGLAWVTLHTASGPASGTHFTCYDGNGNIVSLVSATTSDVTARYEYGPFGEPIRISGPAATLNPFRLSTKRTDSTTDLVIYEYRVYSPTLGRWINRDLLGEEAFFLAYIARKNYGEQRWLRMRSLDPAHVFCQNNPIVCYDGDGCVAPVLIFSVGNAIKNGILACYYCYHLNKCLETAREYSKRAAQAMESEAYLEWLNAAKPGSECAELAEGCGVSVIKLTCWLGARILILRYEVLNPIIK